MGTGRKWLYEFYNRKIIHDLGPADRVPRHIGVITDGNRRWAKESGATTAEGHRAGAQKILEFLGWCTEVGVEVVTLYVLSRENLQRSPEEVEVLVGIIGELVERIADSEDYRVRLVGDLSALPADMRSQLMSSQDRTNDKPQARVIVNVAVGYGGRAEIITAVKAALREGVAAGGNVEEVIESLTEEKLAEHLYTKGLPDPDLIIRSSGEQRLSGFLIWQSAYSEFFFCEAYWPAFRKTDFLRAVRDYSTRQRRYGK